MSDTDKNEKPSEDQVAASASDDQDIDDLTSDGDSAADDGDDADAAQEIIEQSTQETTEEETGQPIIAEESLAGDFSDSATEPPPAVVVRKSGSATIAWLALFLSLITVAGVGYLFIEKQRGDKSASQEGRAVTALSARVDDTAQTIGDLGSSVDALTTADSRTNSQIESLQRDLDNRASLFDSLPTRMSSLEQSVAAIQGVSIDARNTYLIAEAEYYMQIANAQLQLAGNAYLASLALNQADDRILQLADPALTDVRRAIADEVAALEVMEKPDVAGVTLTLASLARVVESLPLRQANREEESVADSTGEEQGGAARAWGAVKGAVSGLVTHTPPSDEDAPLLTPDAEPLIRSNLSLQLQAARLALLRGEQAIFEQSLDDADAWLDTYFEASSESVASARTTIAEIRAGYAVSAAPDISGSLRLLRQYKTLAEPTE